MNRNQWRALDIDGNESVVPTPEPFGEVWRCRGDGVPSSISVTPRRAAIRYALNAGCELVEIRGPGELFTHEQVAAERKRCARWAEAMSESAEIDRKSPSTREAAWHFQGAVISARAIELGIREGKGFV